MAEYSVGTIRGEIQLDASRIPPEMAALKAAMDSVESEIQGLQNSYLVAGSGIDAHGDMVEELTQDHMILRAALADSASAATRSGTAMTAAGTGVVQLGRSKREATESSSRFAMGLLAVGQAADDAQYGFRSIVNNIPQVISLFGLGAGLAGGIGIAAVAINQLINHWDELQAVFGFSETNAEAEKMASLGISTEEAAKQFEKLMSMRSEERQREEKETQKAIAAAGGGELLTSLATTRIQEAGGLGRIARAEEIEEDKQGDIFSRASRLGSMFRTGAAYVTEAVGGQTVEGLEVQRRQAREAEVQQRVLQEEASLFRAAQAGGPAGELALRALMARGGPKAAEALKGALPETLRAAKDVKEEEEREKRVQGLYSEAATELEKEGRLSKGDRQVERFIGRRATLEESGPSGRLIRERSEEIDREMLRVQKEHLEERKKANRRIAAGDPPPVLRRAPQNQARGQ